MMLIVACSINANDNILPLAWALVPIENEFQQKWFCIYLYTAFPKMSKEKAVFISD